MASTSDIHGWALGPLLRLRVEEVDGGLDVEVVVSSDEHDRRRVDGHKTMLEGGEGQRGQRPPSGLRQMFSGLVEVFVAAADSKEFGI